MFRVYSDEELIYDSRYEEQILTKGVISREVNHSGSFVFTLYDSRLKNKIHRLKSIITVYRDEKIIFRGRVIDDGDGFNDDRTYTCEGELSFLIDSICRPYTFNGSPAEMFERLIARHNAAVGEDRRFAVGNVTVTDPNDYISRKNSAYESVLSNIMSRLVEPLGGYLTVTHGVGGAAINWLEDYPHATSQKIEFGENLLDFVKKNDASGIITALIPLGSKIGDSEKRVTIKTVNGGLDYIYDSAAVSKYGWIFGVNIWDDVTVPLNLLSKGRKYLRKSTAVIESIELTAIDLSAMDKDIEAFELGDYVNVVSLPHGLDASYLLSKQDIDILHPENNKITLGAVYGTFTGQTLANTVTGTRLIETAADEQDVQDVEEQVSELSGIISVIQGAGWEPLSANAAFSAIQQIRYKEANGLVSVMGIVSPVANISSSDQRVTVAEGIPESFRPAYDVSFVMPGPARSTWVCTVTTDGEVKASKYGSGGSYGTITTSTVLEIVLSYSI